MKTFSVTFELVAPYTVEVKAASEDDITTDMVWEGIPKHLDLDGRMVSVIEDSLDIEEIEE